MAVAERDLAPYCPDCQQRHRGRCGRYAARHVDLLIDGAYFSDLEQAYKDSPDLEEFQWSRARSRIEMSGDVDSASFTGVLDLERAVSALARKHQLGAHVLLARMNETPTEDLENLMARAHMDFGKVERQAKAYIAAWLSGDDPDAAWRRAGTRPNRRTA